MKIRISGKPEEAADFLLWLGGKEKEIRLITVSNPYQNTRNPRDETVRVYIETEFTKEGEKLCGKR